MLRITIEVLPGGVFQHPPKVVGQATITLVGLSKDMRMGVYRYEIQKVTPRSRKVGSVSGFPRKSASAWELIRRVLNKEKI